MYEKGTGYKLVIGIRVSIVSGSERRFPRSLIEFQGRFATESACAEYLFERRWPERFVCPGCGQGRAWLVRAEAELVLQLQRRDAVGVRRHQKRRPEPKRCDAGALLNGSTARRVSSCHTRPRPLRVQFYGQCQGVS